MEANRVEMAQVKEELENTKKSLAEMTLSHQESQSNQADISAQNDSQVESMTQKLEQSM